MSDSEILKVRNEGSSRTSPWYNKGTKGIPTGDFDRKVVISDSSPVKS